MNIKGGQKMLTELAKTLRSIGNGGIVKVGFLQGSTYPDGSGLSVAQVAFWNEFGTSRAPPRPFFRGMIAAKSPGWGKTLARLSGETKLNSEKTLGLMGQGIKDQLVQSIVEFTDPPNAPSTIAAKGFDKPLIEKGVMQRAVDFVVETGSPDGA